MVGFPGETDAEFEETYAFIERLPFTYLHVFTFSARPGTSAATMPGQVPIHIARQRNKILRDLIASKNRDFRESFVGSTIDAITLQRGSAPQSTEALSDNFVKVQVRGEHAANQWMPVTIEHLTTDGFAARLQ
jgi:threonylcarbamoyladenosine tRNA methylthiotransferase MtaB